MTTLDRLQRLDDRLTEFARGDYVNKSLAFPSLPIKERLRVTSATFRPQNRLDKIRRKLNWNTLGLVDLGPRDQLAKSVRRQRKINRTAGNFIGGLLRSAAEEDIAPGDEWKFLRAELPTLVSLRRLHDVLTEFAEYQGREVPLNKPMRGDVKKSKVYVKDPETGNVKKVNFGDPNMRIKKNIPGRRANFRARHNCDDPGPKTKARYWSCKAW